MDLVGVALGVIGDGNNSEPRGWARGSHKVSGTDDKGLIIKRERSEWLSGSCSKRAGVNGMDLDGNDNVNH